MISKELLDILACRQGKRIIAFFSDEPSFKNNLALDTWQKRHWELLRNYQRYKGYFVTAPPNKSVLLCESKARITKLN